MKFAAPVLLSVLFVWNVVDLFVTNGGIYGSADGYSLTANLIGGWLMTALVFLSGFIVRIVAKRKKAPVSRCTWDTAPRD